MSLYAGNEISKNDIKTFILFILASKRIIWEQI